MTTMSAAMANVAGQYQTGPRPAGNRSRPVAVLLVPDVPRSHPFFSYIETAKQYGLVSGYADGTFRPGNEVTRGQLAKMVVTAAGWNLLNPATATFSSRD